MLVPLGFRHHLLNDHINHGAGGKGQGVGQYGLKHQNSGGSNDPSNGLHYGTQLAIEERFSAGYARPTKGHAHGNAFGEVLQADANGQGHGATEFSTVESGGCGAEGDADCQSFGDVVQGNGQYEECGAFPLRFYAFALVLPKIQVQVGD